MSTSQIKYGSLRQEKFDLDYDELVEMRVEDGPVSFNQLVKELENERRYDDSTPPKDVIIDDEKKLREEFEGLRESNANGELEEELAVSIIDGEQYLRFMTDVESGTTEEGRYSIE